MDTVRMVVALGLTFLLFMLCSQVPIVMVQALWPGTWMGALAAAVAAFVGLQAWVFLVPAMPGLVQGAIHVAGAFWLLVEGVGFLGLAVFRLAWPLVSG